MTEQPVPTPKSVIPAKPSQIKAATPVASPAIVYDDAKIAAAREFGRVDDEGNVYVKASDSERVVGQFPNATEPNEALDFYVKRYLDLAAKLELFGARLQAADLSVREIDTTLGKLSEELKEPSAVGDLGVLNARLEELKAAGQQKRAHIEQQRQKARAESAAAREQLVVAAEEIAGTPVEKMQWKSSGQKLQGLLEDWKSAQRKGPRIDRELEDALWKRFSTARGNFDRARRQYFSELAKANQAAKAAKTAIVEKAQQLQDSERWQETATEFRNLMNDWRAAGRANRADDDRLWQQFKAAQDAFFDRRKAAMAELDDEYGENLKAKLVVLEEAEALLPVKDLNTAKSKLRNIQDRWDEIGRVPRENMHEIENRLQAVELAVREAEDSQWKQQDPELKARAEGLLAQLEDKIAQLQAELAQAEEQGNTKKVAQLKEDIAARQQWLQHVSKTAQE